MAVQDAAGNTVTTSSATVTLAIAPPTGTAGATLTCSLNPMAAVNGLASFTGCSIDKAGSGYTLTATSPGLTSAVSVSFDIASPPDTTPPIADFLTPDEGTTTILRGPTFDVSWSESDEGGSGIAERSLQRERGAVATPASCDGVTFAADGPPLAATSPLTIADFAHGYCYRWTVSLADGAGNPGSQTSGSVLVDTIGPEVHATATGEIGGTVEFTATDSMSCVASASFTVGLPPRSRTFPLEVGGLCDGKLTGKLELAPDNYLVSVRATDRAGNTTLERGQLTVEPTDRVVILVQGIVSLGLDEDTDCHDGLPSGPVSGQLVDRISMIEQAFRDADSRSGVPFEKLTFYVLDYPGITADGTAPEYCFASDSALSRTLLPRYGLLDTTRGLLRPESHLNDLIASFPADTRIDLVGHSQGGIIVTHWLASRTNNELRRVHSVTTLDSPLGGISRKARSLLCLQYVIQLFPGFGAQCYSWQSWDDMHPDNPYMLDITAQRTTHRALLNNFTCDVGCVGSLPFFEVTLPGAWQTPVMFCLDAPIFQLLRHDCFFKDRPSLALLATFAGQEVVDDRQTDKLSSLRSWRLVHSDDFVRASARQASRGGITLDVSILSPRDHSTVAIFYRNPNDAGCAGWFATVQIDDGTPFAVSGVQADDFAPSTATSGRNLCRMMIVGLVDQGGHIVHIRVPGNGTNPFMFDAAEVGTAPP